MMIIITIYAIYAYHMISVFVTVNYCIGVLPIVKDIISVCEDVIKEISHPP